jgi:di/tricarboxylate transporter
MDPPLDWARWFAVALPVSIISILLIWLLLLVTYRPARSPDGEGDIEIRTIRPTKESFTLKQYWVTFVCLATISLWCFEHEIEGLVGDMGVIAIIPIVAFFATGVLKKVGREYIGNALTDSSYLSRMTLNNSLGRLFFWQWVESLLARVSLRVGCW